MSKALDISLLAILYELNDREFKKRLSLFPEEMRFYGILAGSIIGLENSKRLDETPQGVVGESEAFVAKLLGMVDPGQDEAFRHILETFLVEALREELRFCCPNCRGFGACLDVDNLAIGELFRRRVNGEETEALKAEIRGEVERALLGTPHLGTGEAHKLCRNFKHQYDNSDLGGLFGRYADVAAVLQKDFGIH